MQIRVWSEREPSGTAFTDCTYCSLLMVLVGGGNATWPLGAFTDAERRAFRDGDPRLNFDGGVEQARRRYGVTIHTLADRSQSGLRAALSTPGNVFAVAGKLANFPAGHRLRRMDPTFTGFHAVCVLPRGGGMVTWYDPLAPMGFDGDPATVSEVVDTFAQGNFPNDARFLRIDELQGANMTTIVNARLFLGANGQPAPREIDFAAGSYTGFDAATGASRPFTFSQATSAHADAECHIIQDPQKAPNGHGFLRMIDGVFLEHPEHPFVLGTQPGLVVTPDPVAVPDCTAQVAAATAPLKARIERLEDEIVDLKRRLAGSGEQEHR